ncbi:MAG: response regulator [Synergistaceae bacterium]|nr:response regulator [Synergistaceae bacterium]
MAVTEKKERPVVLVCDDSVLVRRMMRDILKEGGIAEILEAQDGLEAVELYRNHRPDLVFMDIVMPKQNGLDALVAIREYDQAARVIMASSAGTHKNLKSAIDAGACDFIQKPFEKEAVLDMLRRNLEGKWD